MFSFTQINLRSICYISQVHKGRKKTVVQKQSQRVELFRSGLVYVGIKMYYCNLFKEMHIHTHTHSFGPYKARALFSVRSFSSCIFCAYSLSLISQTFLMMEASQPTASGFFSVDIFKLLQTPCTHREKDKKTSEELLLCSHLVSFQMLIIFVIS